MTGPTRDVYSTPRCPAGCFGKACRAGRHERDLDLSTGSTLFDFVNLTIWIRRPENEPSLSFMQVAGIALMVNSERDLPAGSYENCTECGAGVEGCPCEPNLLAILAREEGGGSEWQS